MRKPDDELTKENLSSDEVTPTLPPSKPNLKVITRESVPDGHSKSIQWQMTSDTLAAFSKKYQMTEIKVKNKMSVDQPASGDNSSKTHLKVSGLDQDKSSPQLITAEEITTEDV